MPGHGNHWETLYDIADYTREQLAQDCEAGALVGRWPCVDVVGGTDRSEQIACLRHGGERLTHQVLVISNTPEGTHELFSAYPVALDGIVHRVTIERIEPWEYGIEAWIHGRVTYEAVALAFFDTEYFAGSASLQPGDTAEVSLAALAYWLRPIQTRSFDICEGPMWEIERQRRLEEGASPDEADRAVTIHLTGAAVFLPRDDDAPDDAQFQGVIDALECFRHFGQLNYRLEVVVLRAGDEALRLPIFASERVLNGYVPRLGDDVEGVLWLQGRVLRPGELTTPTDRHVP